MTSVARSQVLIAHASVGNEYTPLFTAPAGYVVLVKAAHLTNSTAGALRVVLIAGPLPGGGNINLVDLNLAAGVSYYWNGWAALNPGQYVGVYQTAAGIYSWVSGAVLAGPNQFPIAGAGVAVSTEPYLPIPPPGEPVDWPPRR